MKKKLFLSIALCLPILSLLSTQSKAIHDEDVVLRGYDNAPVSGSSNPYSPKNSCGLTSCHDTYVVLNFSYLQNIYESNFALATKTHVNKNGEIVSYEVPYPQHGISASYHVQMGRNDTWGDLQRQYYDGLEEFTSSSGHYGRY